MTDELTLEQIQMLDAAHRASRPRLTERQARHELIEVMARFLHYQEKGEPDWANMTALEHTNETSRLPEAILARYMNDAKFHSQVDRAVHTVLDIWDRCSERRNEQSS